MARVVGTKTQTRLCDALAGILQPPHTALLAAMRLWSCHHLPCWGCDSCYRSRRLRRLAPCSQYPINSLHLNKTVRSAGAVSDPARCIPPPSAGSSRIHAISVPSAMMMRSATTRSWVFKMRVKTWRRALMMRDHGATASSDCRARQWPPCRYLIIIRPGAPGALMRRRSAPVWRLWRQFPFQFIYRCSLCVLNR